MGKVGGTESATNERSTKNILLNRFPQGVVNVTQNLNDHCHQNVKFYNGWPHFFPGFKKTDNPLGQVANVEKSAGNSQQKRMCII